MTDPTKPEPVPPLPVEPEPDTGPATPAAAERGGRGGLDPTRYGDWENKGIAVDF